jgi:bifunctional N-acetylglucosamine-1-phosphate-uridyltransferase/glucosamine-1-phosphate-acetyltransferase GlmU-like protein
MFPTNRYINELQHIFPDFGQIAPWTVIHNLPAALWEKIKDLPEADYNINNGVAVHKSAIIETGVILKPPVIIRQNCFVGAHAYLRDGVFLDESVKIGPGCEIKTSIIFSFSTLAHFNFAGNSMIGSHVNMEAGAVIANHYNDRTEKNITVTWEGNKTNTGMDKFGALVGDACKIGANAVLSPGTVLERKTVVGRLELVEQNPAIE